MPAPLPPEIEAVLDGLKAINGQWIARCPSHEDRNPSLTLKVEEGKLLVHCHAGCDPKLVLDALGYKPPRRDDGFVDIYNYVDEHGTLLFQVCRTSDKRFLQRRPGFGGEWIWKLENTRRVLFRLPELIEADGVVYIAEGERDVLALVGIGKVATCNPGGAGKWRPEYAEHFKGANVIVFIDKDQPGREHGKTIAASLEGVAEHVWLRQAADPHKDIAAHLAAGLTLEQTLPAVLDDPPAEILGPDDLLDVINSVEPDHDWLVEGLLEKGSRLILTGSEGLGKSSWLRAFGVQLAAGIHPVTFAHIEPLRVLMIDAENSRGQVRFEARHQVRQALAMGRPLRAGMFRVVIDPAGLDLTQDADAEWLCEQVQSVRPHVLILGPAYRLYCGNPNDEELARKLTKVLDRARELCGCAVLLEAHAGHAEIPGKQRQLRPAGSSLWLRWPEFGFGLRRRAGDTAMNPAEISLEAWRPPRVGDTCWPQELGWSHEWRAWTPSLTRAEQMESS